MLPTEPHTFLEHLAFKVRRLWTDGMGVIVEGAAMIVAVGLVGWGWRVLVELDPLAGHQQALAAAVRTRG